MVEGGVGVEEEGLEEVVVDDYAVDGAREAEGDGAFSGAGGAGHLDNVLAWWFHGGWMGLLLGGGWGGLW